MTAGFPGGSDGKEYTCDAGDVGSIPGSGRSPGEGNGNPFQFLPGESHGQSLAGSNGHNWATNTFTFTNDHGDSITVVRSWLMFLFSS